MVHDTVDAHGFEPHDMLGVEPGTLANGSPELRQQQPRGNLLKVLGEVPKLIVVDVGEEVSEASVEKS